MIDDVENKVLNYMPVWQKMRIPIEELKIGTQSEVTYWSLKGRKILRAIELK